jgi:hypothetical protein
MPSKPASRVDATVAPRCVVIPFVGIREGGDGVTGFDVTAGELYATGAALEEMSQQVSSEVGALQAQMDALLGGGWQGQAANSFGQGLAAVAHRC